MTLRQAALPMPRQHPDLFPTFRQWAHSLLTLCQRFAQAVAYPPGEKGDALAWFLSD